MALLPPRSLARHTATFRRLGVLLAAFLKLPEDSLLSLRRLLQKDSFRLAAFFATSAHGTTTINADHVSLNEGCE